jgi:hypothetical protein
MFIDPMIGHKSKTPKTGKIKPISSLLPEKESFLRMDSTPISVTLSLLSRDHQEKLRKAGPLVSVSQLFATLPDPRSRHGQRYDLPFLLTCLVAAMLCNCNSSVAIAQWCQEHQDLLRQVFGPREFLSPSSSLYRWLLPQLSVNALEATLAYWVQITLVAKPDDPIALSWQNRAWGTHGR